MFRRADRTTTERRQILDDTTEDEEIKTLEDYIDVIMNSL